MTNESGPAYGIHTRLEDGALLGAADMQGVGRRALLRGAGMSAAKLRRRPVIGICNSWSELNPCNGNLNVLARRVREGVEHAGGIALEFSTVSLSEPFVRPSSMFLRNLMSIDVEEMIRASPLDGVVLLGGCDKTVPAQLMGAASAGRPAIMLTSGPRRSGSWRGRPLSVDDIWDVADERRRGLVSDDEWDSFEGNLARSAGVCNAMGTAMTMAVVSEALGVALPGSASAPADSAEREEYAVRTGATAVAAVRSGLSLPSLLTEAAFRNGLRVLLSLAGSTNALLHLQALAGRVGIRLDLDTVESLSRSTPVLADVRPSGAHPLEAFGHAGGTPALMRELADLLDLDCLTITGATLGANLAEVGPPSGPGVRSRSTPVAENGGLSVLRGNLAPRGALLKAAAATPCLLKHRGPAVVFEGADDLARRLDDPSTPITEDSVLVLRGVGPVGYPGMPELGYIPMPARLLERGIMDMVRISDARMSGTNKGTVILHVAPEAATGGPLSLVRDGDVVELDAEHGRLDLDVPPDVLAARRQEQPGLRPLPERGYARMYARHVLQADEGCDFDFLRADQQPTQQS